MTTVNGNPICVYASVIWNQIYDCNIWNIEYVTCLPSESVFKRTDSNWNVRSHLNAHRPPISWNQMLPITMVYLDRTCYYCYCYFFFLFFSFTVWTKSSSWSRSIILTRAQQGKDMLKTFSGFFLCERVDAPQCIYETDDAIFLLECQLLFFSRFFFHCLQKK